MITLETELNEADPNPEPPHPLLDEDPLLVDDGGNDNNSIGQRGI